MVLIDLNNSKFFMHAYLMRSFKLYMESLKGDENLFETVFSDFYSKGYYGNELTKEEIRENEFRWFKTFKKVISTKDYSSILYLLNGSDNHRITREWFSRLTSYDISRKSNQYIEKIVREYCDMDANRKTVICEWKRYINMSPEEVEEWSKEKTRANYFLEQMKSIKDKKEDEISDNLVEYMAKHLRLLNRVKESKVPIRNVQGEPTSKFLFLKMLGCDPDRIKNG